MRVKQKIAHENICIYYIIHVTHSEASVHCHEIFKIVRVCYYL